MIDVFLGDADPVVGHFDQNIAVHIVETHLGMAAVAAVFDGVADEVDQHLPDTFPVGPHLEVLVGARFEDQFDAAFARLHFQVFEHFQGQVADVEILHFEDQFARLEAGDRFEVFDDRVKTFDVLVGPFKVAAMHLWVVHAPVEQGFQIALDIEDRRLQFVRDIPQEAAAVFLPFLERFDLFSLVFRPLRHLLLHLVDDVGRQIDGGRLFLRVQFVFVNGLVDQFDLPVDVPSKVVNGRQVGRGKNDGQYQ